MFASLIAFSATAQTQDENRLALLIGNATYKSSPLTNPVNDVRLMESALRESGFKIIKAENASRREMLRLIRDFGERLKQSGGVGLFYFAGHGVQIKGANYLVPVDADIRAEDEVAFDSVDAQSILEKMETAKNRVNLLILDACRDNPFAKGSRSGSAGLATMSAPSGSLVAYSTAPGSVASDGSGKNGLYTQHLSAVMRVPDIPIEEIFKRVRTNVRKDSANQQTPWENTALEGSFYFKRSPPSAAAAAALAPVPTPQATQVTPAAPNMMAVELAYWDSIKASNRPFELEAYIEQFPNGAFVNLAKARLREVSNNTAKANAANTQILDDPVLGKGSLARDPKTGLVWQRCSAGQTWDGSTCTGTAQQFTFDAAQKLATNGWRVPTIRELASLVYCSSGKTQLHIDPKDGAAPIANLCDGDYVKPTIRAEALLQTAFGAYWSSSPGVGDSNVAWFVHFNYGGVNDYDRYNLNYVRLVR
ncbi:MAG: caspase family protein [Cytophagales bacterium]|nr:caspase family protein [Cytophagales bacterium]